MKRVINPNSINGEIDSSAACDELAEHVGFNQNGCCADDTEYVIKGILVAEIRRLRQEYAHLKYLVENYLNVLQLEKEEKTK